MKTKLIVIMALFSLGCVSAPASYDFTSFNATSPWHTDAGLVITLDVLAQGTSQVRFRIQNNSSFDCVVTEVYFDDSGELGGLVAIDRGTQDSKRVSFAAGATPKEVPSASNLTPAFATTSPQGLFSASAKNPGTKYGLNYGGEYIDLIFTLNNGYAVNSIINDITSRALRVAVHVQAFPNGAASTSMINNPSECPNVPEPATCALLGLGGLSMLRKRK